LFLAADSIRIQARPTSLSALPVAHHKTVTHPKYGTADGSGKRTVWYYISGATPGYRVVVDVYVSRNGRKGSCSTSFTPHR
jgi:hypothetical protein